MLFFALTISLTSCKKNEKYVSPSGNVSIQTKSIASFSELDISDPFNVYITFSAFEESIKIEANDNLHAYIQVSKNNNRLIIKLDENINIREGEAKLNLYITLIDLKKIEGVGATKFHFQNQMIGDKLEVELEGASSLIGMLNVKQLNAKILGGSNLDIDGVSDSFIIDANGASNMINYGFETYKLEAELGGASNLNLTVHDKMDVKASGASKVFYKGNGVVGSQNLSGDSKIVKVQ